MSVEGIMREGGLVSHVSQICACAGGEEYLWYKVPKKIDVAILRGTTADVDGNVTFEKEAMLADCLNQVHGDMCFCSL